MVPHNTIRIDGIVILSGASGTRRRSARAVEGSLLSHSRHGNEIHRIVILHTAEFSIERKQFVMQRERRYYCVYIMGSLSGTLYIGFSGNLHKRVFQHKFHHFEGFTDKYDVTRLLYWESYDDVHRALARETQLKGWSRAKKIGLIVKRNPHWVDLAREWYPWMKEGGCGSAKG